MRWAEAASVLIAELLDDDAFVDALGGQHLYRAGEHGKLQIPGVYHQVIFATLGEVYEPFIWQFDVYAPEITTALAIEKRLRKVLDRKIFQLIGGIMMSTRYEESRDHADPELGVIHRSLDFRVEPVRAR